MKKSNHKLQRKKQAVQASLLKALVTSTGKWLPSLASYWAYRFWISTFRFTEPARETTWREGAIQSFITPKSLNGQKICVYHWGKHVTLSQRPLIMLVHGWNGRATQMAAFVEPLVSAGFQVIGFDAPGHGASDGEHTNILEFCNVMADICDSFGPIHGVVAHSFGVPCSVLALAENRIKVDKIVCISSPISINWLLGIYCRLLNCPAAVKNSIKRRIETQFGATIWQRLQTDQMVESLTSSAFIIHDKNDNDIPWKHAEKLSELWPDSNFLLTKGLGHQRILHDQHVITQTASFLMT